MAKTINCVKCGGKDLTVKYCKASTSSKDKVSEKAEECLLRKCSTCGYGWEEPCEDK